MTPSCCDWPPAVKELADAVSDALDRHHPPDVALDALLWDALRACEGRPFATMKGLAFTYRVKGNELFVDRKEKSLTRATVLLAFHNALSLRGRGEPVPGPKTLKTFGASYLFPVFQAFGVLPGPEGVREEE